MSTALRLLTAAALIAGTCTAAVADDPVASGPVVVPLHVNRGPMGDPRLGIDVTVGEKTVQVLADTGSRGLRVLASAVPAGSVHRTGRAAAGGYASGIVLHGEAATAPLALGAARAPAADIELVDGISCADGRPDCPAANGSKPEMFGVLFPGILGLGSIDPPRGQCCSNPLPALAGGVGRTYVVRANFGAPELVLNPDAATVRAFTLLDVSRGTLPRGCVRVSASPNEVCGEVLFDTGTPQLVVTTTGIAAAGPYPPGTTATLTVGGWSHAFAVGPGTPLRLNLRRGDTNRIVVGLAALQSVDVYYDLAGGRMGLLAR